VERDRVPVDVGGERGVVASGEGVGGSAEEGDVRREAIVKSGDGGGELEGRVTAVVGCLQSERVRAGASGSRARERRGRCGSKQRNKGP